VMPLDVLGRTRATLMQASSILVLSHRKKVSGRDLD
jgi:hypothetical protein